MLIKAFKAILVRLATVDEPYEEQVKMVQDNIVYWQQVYPNKNIIKEWQEYVN